MNSFVCVLRKAFRNHLFAAAVATRRVTLPFPPSVGLPLTGYAADPTFRTVPEDFAPDKVVWVGKDGGPEGEFRVNFPAFLVKPEENPADVAAEVLGEGWTVTGFGV